MKLNLSTISLVIAPLSVTNLNYMFSFADLFNQDVSGWDVSLVTEMNKMFHRAESLSDLNKGKIHESFSANPNGRMTGVS